MGRRRVTKIGADLDFGKSGLRGLWFAIGSGHWSLHPFTPMLGCGSNAFPVTPALAELFQRIEVAACAGSFDLDLQHENRAAFLEEIPLGMVKHPSPHLLVRVARVVALPITTRHHPSPQWKIPSSSTGDRRRSSLYTSMNEKTGWVKVSLLMPASFAPVVACCQKTHRVPSGKSGWGSHPGEALRRTRVYSA